MYICIFYYIILYIYVSSIKNWFRITKIENVIFFCMHVKHMKYAFFHMETFTMQVPHCTNLTHYSIQIEKYFFYFM